MKIQNLSSRIVPWIWTYRFWRRLSDQTGLSAADLQDKFSPQEIEALVADFDSDPEAAADIQLAKLGDTHLVFDGALCKMA